MIFGFQSDADAEEFVRRLATKDVTANAIRVTQEPYKDAPNCWPEFHVVVPDQGQHKYGVAADEFWEARDLKHRYVVKFPKG